MQRLLRMGQTVLNIAYLALALWFVHLAHQAFGDVRETTHAAAAAAQNFRDAPWALGQNASTYIRVTVGHFADTARAEATKTWDRFTWH